jgi:nucleotide-binding universal stress UspA family protein
MTLVTCKVLAIRAENDTLVLEQGDDRKNMVVVYDGGEHSDVVLKATSWLEHSGRFKVNLLSINRGGGEKDAMQQDYLGQLGVELKEVQLAEGSARSADIVLSAASAFNPDIVVMGATVGGFSTFSNPDFLALLDQFNCPVIIARDFTIPGVHRAKSALMRVFKR